MAAQLQLALLGNPEVRRVGVPIAGLSSGKALALLCYLVVTGRPLLRPTLVGLLWGDMPENSARNNLSKALTYLRQAVGPHLDITRHVVAFNREIPYWLDIEAFEEGVSARADVEQMERAVELYRGDFLEGFYVRQAPAFEEWVLTQRARLRELVLDALHTLAVHHTRRGSAGHAAAMEYTARLLALEPWREEAHRQLMLLLAQSGQRSAALAQYEACRQMLTEELGVEPGPETAALYQRIRDGTLPGEVLNMAERGLSPGPQRGIAAVVVAPPPFLSSPSPLPAALPPFVARERELAQLDGYLEGALSGRGQVALVTGEAGTGKTALVQEFVRRAQKQHGDLIVAMGNCNAYTGLGDPYLPFREILGLLTGDVEPGWAAGTLGTEGALRLWNLIPLTLQLLVQASPDLVDTFLPGLSLAARAAVAVPGGAPWLDRLQALVASVEPGRGRPNLEQADLFAQVAALLTDLARERPLLLAVDDLQWADAGSIHLLFHLGRRLAAARILIVGIYRPSDVAMGREGKRHPLAPVLSELQRTYGPIRVELRQSEDLQFLDALVDTEPNRLGSEFRQALYQQTKGHALFTVEMLRGMRERGDLVQDQAGCWVEGSAIDWASLPARVEGVIGERFSRLPMALQEALKVASVEGEEFTAEVVARVRGTGELETVGQLSGELDRRHRLVRNQGSHRAGPGGPRTSRYRFRHILFQRYVYNSLDQTERSYLHEAVGTALEQLYEGQSGAIAIHLARHYQAAGQALKAVDCLQQAGERAMRSYAYREAMLLFNEALSSLQALSDTPERARRELALQLARGGALVVAKGFAAPEVKRAYTRARELCRQAGPTPELFPALFGLCVYYMTRAEHQMGRELAAQLLELAQNTGDPDLLLQAHHASWTCLLCLGEYAAAQAHVEQAIALYDAQRHRAHASRYAGHDAKVCGLCWGGLALWFLGYPDQASEKGHQALAWAQELSHPVSLTLALKWLATLHQLRREEGAVQERAEAAVALATEQRYLLFAGWAGTLQGWALALQGQGVAGVARIRQGLATYQATGAAMDRPYMLALLAEAYGAVGQIAEGLSALDEAFAVVHRTGERYYEAELHRLKGELLRRRGEGADASEVEICFRTAIEVARRQGARSLELRAATSLSRLWQSQGKQEQARQMLGETYGWFSEGFDTADLKEAKTLLEELG